MMNENTLQETIEHTTTDVINRLHHLKGMDRYYLLMEHLVHQLSMVLMVRLFLLMILICR